jgi:hypothetical protein
MSKILTQIAKVSNKIEISPNCGYLYQYFDELVALLEPLKYETLPPVVIRGLKGLIQDLASESTYNNFSSAHWMKYSARSFYCADNLVKYLPENQQEFFYSYLNGIFAELMNSGVAPIIEKEVFDRYIKMNLTDDKSLKVYDEQIRKAIKECDKSRLWSAGDACLACDYMKSIDRMIRTYVKQSGDYSLLHEWIPLLRIRHVTKYRNGYPDTTWYEYASENEREVVMSSLNKILQIQGYLHCLWYWNSPEELISNLSVEELVDMFEAFDDRMFDDILRDMAEHHYDNKVRDVLEHFAGHNDKVVAGFAGQLLDYYKSHK